jgi:hypothetical protein
MEEHTDEAAPTRTEVPPDFQESRQSDGSRYFACATTLRRDTLDLVAIAKLELGSPSPDFVAVSYAFGCIRQEGGPYHQTDGGISDRPNR